MKGVEKKDDSIEDKGTEVSTVPMKEPSLTERQDDISKTFELVPIKMVTGRRNTYYHRCKKAFNSSKTCLWLVVLFPVYWKQAS